MRIYKTKHTAGNISGMVSLKLVGFGAQNYIEPEKLVKIIELIPNHHLNRLDEINYDPFRVIPRVLNQTISRSIKGCYIERLRTIALFEFSSSAELLHILFHEIGHHVYYRIIDSTVKKEWVTKICRNAGHISRYSAVNASEDFAECYANYVLSPEELKKIELKYNYMASRVF